MIAFYDQDGNGYVPPGVTVVVYPLGASLTDANIVAQGVVGVAGVLNAALPPNEFYYAVFDGVPGLTPIYQAIFQSNGDGAQTTVVNVPSFVSPFQSQAGYASQIRGEYPYGWIDNQPINTEVADTWFAGIGGGMAAIDSRLQQIRAALRLPSCPDEFLDSWAQDYFGTLLKRIPGETQPLYVARLLIFTGRLRLTLACIAQVVYTYLASSANLPLGGQGLGLDSSGGLNTTSGGLDVTPAGSAPGQGSQNNLGLDSGYGYLDTTHGGIDSAAQPESMPTIEVFDLQSDPTTSALLGLPKGKFCIYFKYDGYNQPPQVMATIDSALDFLVGIVKPAGIPPVYATNKY
jgi:hypothetical protein